MSRDTRLTNPQTEIDLMVKMDLMIKKDGQIGCFRKFERITTTTMGLLEADLGSVCVASEIHMD
jgi:hypothetical protein